MTFVLLLLLLLAVVVSVAAHANANVKRVAVKYLQEDTFLFEVSIEHDDEGDHYCDGWSVYSDNTAMTLYTGAAGSREGMTVHFAVPLDDETSQGTVVIPKNVERVVVRAHDKQHGFGGLEITVEVGAARQRGSFESTEQRHSKIAALD